MAELIDRKAAKINKKRAENRMHSDGELWLLVVTDEFDIDKTKAQHAAGVTDRSGTPFARAFLSLGYNPNAPVDRFPDGRPIFEFDVS